MGKYKPKDLINHLSKSKVPKKIRNLGLCCQEVNVFDNKKKSLLTKQYLKKYNPYKKTKKIRYKLSEIVGLGSCVSNSKLFFIIWIG